MDPLEEAPWADAATTSTSQSSSQQHQDDNTATSKPSESSAGGSSSLSASTGGPRPSRLTPRRLLAQPTRLQAVEDDPLGPLGAPPSTGATTPGAAPLSENLSPTGGSSDTGPPAPPKEHSLAIRPGGGAQQRRGGPPDPHRIDDDDDDDRLFDTTNRGPRVPPPVAPAPHGPGGAARPGGVAQSVSIEQAAKPTFWITVGDPHKVGDLTSSHIVYSVRTKVRYACGIPSANSLRKTSANDGAHIDDIKGLQTARVRGQETIQGLPVAVQHAAWE